MALNYSIAYRKNPLKSEEPAKAYATAQSVGTLSVKAMSQRIAMQTTVSRADVMAVLTSLVDNIFIALQEGYQIDMGDLGKFRLHLSSEGVASATEFTADNIKGVNIRFVPGKELKNVFTSMEFEPVPTREAVRKLLKAQKNGDDSVSLTDEETGGEDMLP